MNKIILAILIAIATTPCFATLGEVAASAQSEKAALHATNYKISAKPFYKVETYKIADVVNVREYVAKDGMVFAVSWKGPFKPDLQQLLGQYYHTLNASITRRPGAGRSPVYIKRSDIVIESGGHPHAFYGRAYIPAALPSGMNEGEIQ